MGALRKSAKGRQCQVRVIGHCNWNPETVVLAHIGGAGMGMKANDIHGAFCCSSCHDVYGMRAPSRFTRDEIKLAFLQGVIATQRIWLGEGLLRIGDAKVVGKSGFKRLWALADVKKYMETPKGEPLDFYAARGCSFSNELALKFHALKPPKKPVDSLKALADKHVKPKIPKHHLGTVRTKSDWQ